MPAILVVEDSPTQAEELRFILQEAGYQVELAQNGQSGLEQVRSRRFDLVLSDVLMPDLSGYEFCRQVKMAPATRSIPVVLLTQLSDPLDILHGLECGADNFITKPFDPAYLVSRIRDILSNQARQAQGEPGGAVTLQFRGQGVTITANKGQILDLLLASMEESVRSHSREREAQHAKDKLAREAAESAHTRQVKDRHLAMLAHELRNPMAALHTSVEVLRQTNVGREAREQSLDRMDRQLHHLKHLLDDLLDASRVVQGKLRLKQERLDLAGLVRTAAEDHRAALLKAGLKFEVQVPPRPVWHSGDRTRLTQVIDNLLDNAARHTRAGGRVAIELAVEAGPLPAVLSVKDNGAGIAADVLPRLFEPFVQGAQTLNRPGGGLGLGLSLVKGLVELHGGTVAATSAGVGLGAVFTVRLPVAEEATALAEMPATTHPSGAGRRVLVVEDHKDAAESLRTLLGLLGYDVRTAFTGPQGVHVAKTWAPEIVLCDIGLPLLDGYGVARALRRDSRTARARLIALTGYGSDEDVRRSRQAGFDYHLTKPANPQVLMQLLAMSS